MPETTISITTSTLLKVVVVVAGAWLLYILRDLVLVIITAVVIASAIEPGVNALSKYKMPRVFSVLLIYLFIITLFLGIFYFFLPSVLTDLATFAASMPQYLDVFGQVGAFDEYAQILGVPSPAQISSDQLMQTLRDSLDFSKFFGNAFSAASTVFGGVFSFVLILVFSFYFAVIETGVDDFLRVIVPQKHQAYMLDLWRRSQRKIGLWMQGQLLLGLIIGVLVYLGLTILGIKHALLLAVIAAMFELIPVFGPTFAAIPAVIIGFVDGGFAVGVLVIALYVILQQFENHLIYPLVVTKVVGVPPLLVILALIIGAQLAGFLGILLSVPAAAALQEFVKDIETRRAFATDSGNV